MGYLELADIAADQWGLVTSAQARAAGHSAQALARLVRCGYLHSVTRGVYLVAGAPGPRDEWLHAAWLLLDPGTQAWKRLKQPDPGGVASHVTAAGLHSLGTVCTDRYEFIVGRRRQSRRTDVRLYRATLTRDDWTRTAESLPVTTVKRTIRDLAAAHIDGGHLADVVRDALLDHKIDPDDVIATLAPFAHCYGYRRGDGEALLRRHLDESGGVPLRLQRIIELS